MYATNDTPRGFTLVEMAVTLLLVGLLLAFSVPAIQNMSNSYQLKANTENIAAQLRLARERAIATGQSQTMHFTANYLNSDFHIHNGSSIPAKWKFPSGITYRSGTGSISSVTMGSDGRSNISGIIILQDRRANRDTVSVQLSGLVLTQ